MNIIEKIDFIVMASPWEKTNNKKCNLLYPLSQFQWHINHLWENWPYCNGFALEKIWNLQLILSHYPSLIDTVTNRDETLYVVLGS